jgi:hypothetical protein
MLLLLISYFLFSKASAYPDLTRHGYTSCRACHVSPAGGGALNAYGRSMSKELLSTWSYEGEEEVLHGMLPKDWIEKYKENFIVGGNVRAVQTYVDNEQREAGEFFLMQTQVHIGFKAEKIEGIVSIGKIENPRESETIHWEPAEYYLNFLLSDEAILRVGQFNPSFGISMPDHTLWTRSQTGMMPWLERDTVELSFQSEDYSLFVSGFQSSDDNPANFQTTGHSTNFLWNYTERQQVGISYKTEEGKITKNQTYSLWGKFSPFKPEAYILAEIDRIKTSTSVQTVGFVRGGYEVKKGVTPLLQVQHQDKARPSKEQNWRYGLGLQFFPRPHWEVFMLFEEVKLEQQDAKEGFIVFHYYL